MKNRQSRTNASMIAPTAAACLALAFVGWFTPSADAQAPTGPALNAASSAPVQIAGLLVPKRTRIVIKFERTAVC